MVVALRVAYGVICFYTYIRTHTCIHIYMHVHMYIYVCVYIHVCVKYPLLSSVSKGTSTSGAATVVIKMNNMERM